MPDIRGTNRHIFLLKMGLLEQLSRKKDDSKQLIEFAFPYAKDEKGNLIFDDEEGVLTVSDYSQEQIHNYYRLEILYAILIENFVIDEKKKKIARDLKKKFYLIPISKDRRGRIEIFETLKAKYQRQLEIEQQQKTREGVI